MDACSIIVQATAAPVSSASETGLLRVRDCAVCLRLHGIGGEDELAGVDARADRELRAIAFAEPAETDGCASLLVGGGDRCTLAEAAVEADREASRRVVVDRTAHPHDAADMRQQRLGLHVAVAGAHDDQLDRAARCAEGLLERLGRDQLGATIGPLEVQARLQLAAATGEVEHRRLEPAQLAEQIERLCGPSGHKLEAVPEAAALQLRMD